MSHANAGWECFCHAINPIDADICQTCCMSWSCCACSQVNPLTNETCDTCGASGPLGDTPASPAAAPGHKVNKASNNYNDFCYNLGFEYNQSDYLNDEELAYILDGNNVNGIENLIASNIASKSSNNNSNHNNSVRKKDNNNNDNHNNNNNNKQNSNADRKKNIYYNCKKSDESSERFRDRNALKEYRNKSQSQYKDNKHASHYVSLELMNAISGHIPGREATEQIKRALNEASNIRMVNKDVNNSSTRSDGHRRIDNRLIDIINGDTNDTQLTYHESRRAKAQCNEIMSNDTYPLSVQLAAKKQYSKMRDNNGNKIWDERKECGKLRQTRLNNNSTYSIYEDKELIAQHIEHARKEREKAARILEMEKQIREQERNELLKKRELQRTRELEKERKRQEKEAREYRQRQERQSQYGNGSTNYYQSNGSANGREIHTGARGGKFYYTASGKKQYIKQ